MSGYVKDRERENMNETVIVPGRAKQAEFAVSQWGRQIALNVRSVCWRHWVTVSKGADGHKPNAEFAHLRLRHHVQTT